MTQPADAPRFPVLCAWCAGTRRAQGLEPLTVGTSPVPHSTGEREALDMAEILEQFPRSTRAEAGKSKYESLLDGQIWRCHRGRDFTCTTRSFQSYLTTFAKNHGKRLRTVRDDVDTLVVQARPPEQ